MDLLRFVAKGLQRSALLVGLALTAQSAFAETPSTKISTAPLISPAVMAGAGYSSAEPTHDAVLPARPKEIVELTRALKTGRSDGEFVDQVYSYVRNNIEIAWMFGLQKGGLGAIVDHSGTAFDQAHLMVETLRQGGVNARYQFGTITLNGDQFYDWSGIKSATAACQLLSSGGIPASINGAVNAACAYGSSEVSTVTLSHVWVVVSLGGADVVFDPAYKAHAWTAGAPSLPGAVWTGETMAQAAIGMESGTATAPYIRKLQADAMVDSLENPGGLASRVQGVIDNGYTTADIDDLVGGGKIKREYPTGLRQSTLPYGSQTFKTWDAVPDDYRTTLTVQVVRTTYAGDRPIFNRKLFVDDIYGRKLTIISRDLAASRMLAGNFTDILQVADELGLGTTVASYVSDALDTPNFNDADITLTVNHPYPDAAGVPGIYMDGVVTKHVTMWMPLVIVNGWGDIGRGFVDKWGARDDNPGPQLAESETTCGDVCNPYAPAAGDGRREQLAAAWLSQSGRAAKLHAALAKSIYTHHHSLGVVAADTRIKTVYYTPSYPASGLRGYYVSDSFDRVDIDSAFSLTSSVADPTARRAAVHAIAETLEVLEGSVAAQVADLPDTASVATRFAWGNSPPTAEDAAFSDSAGARRFYAFGAGDWTVQPDVFTKFEGRDSAPGTGLNTKISEPSIDSVESDQWRSRLYEAIKSYAGAGFDVVASSESFLGPGQRGGEYNRQGTTGNSYSHRQTFQRGGALIATKYANGEPVEIAHVTVGASGRAKGGGGGAQGGHQAQYDPSKAADVLKAKFVDRSKAVGVDLMAGGLTYSSPATLETGAGEFPDKLSAQVFWRGGQLKGDLQPAGVTEPQTPWSTNWNNTLTISGSGMEAMGLTDVRASAGTIAAFLAMQDVYKTPRSAQREVTASLVGAWWAGQLVHNVVTVNVGADTRQFVRKFDGAWLAPGPGAYGTLQSSGPQPTPYTHTCEDNTYVQTRGWNYAGITFTVTGAHGDIQTFPYWETRVQQGGFCSDMHGFRLTTWAFPKGVTVTLGYTPTTGQPDRLTSVSNNLGRQLTFGYTSGQLSSITDGVRSIVLATDFAGTYTHTDPAGKATRFVTALQGAGVGSHYELKQVFAADDPSTPALQYDYDSLARVSSAKDRLALQNGRSPHTFLLGHGLHGERIDPLGHRHAVDYDDDKRAVRFVDELNRVSLAGYDGRGRVTRYTYPLLDQEEMAYDEHNNPILLRKLAKPGSAEAGQALSFNATWDQTWNKVASLSDAKGQRTDFTYVSSGGGAGEMASAVQPAVTGGRPTYSFTYNTFGQLASTTDPANVLTTYDYDGSHYLSTTTLDPGGVAATTTLTNNAFGDPVDIDGPRTDVADISHTYYDLLRRKTLEVQPDPGAGKATATQTVYDDVGRVKETDLGYVQAGVFHPVIATTIEFDAVGNKIKQTTPAGITQFSYDGLNRLLCTAQRQNPQVAPPSDACEIAAVDGAFGPDHISQNTYDEAGQLTAVTLGLHRENVLFARYKYSPNGQRTEVRDGVNNVTTLTYDGFDRLVRQNFPLIDRSATASNPADHEDYAYDENGNRRSLTKRDGTLITFGYDPLDRMTSKVVTGKPAENVVYAYDLAGKITASTYQATGEGITYGYDTAGRQTTETSYGWTVASMLDKAGNRGRLTWPDLQAVEFVYDAANRLTQIREPGAASGPGRLVDLSYDDLGRRTQLLRGNGGHGDYHYDAAGRLDGLTQAGTGSAPISVQTLTYSPASQLVTLTQASLDYVWQGRPAMNAFTYNGLNQQQSIAVLPNGFDKNGNLTNSGVRTYTYDSGNRMTHGGNATEGLDLTYDPVGRLRSTHSATGAWTYFLYSGTQLIGEYAAGGAGQPALRRYVHGAGVDEPVVWYEGAGVAQRRWFHPDRQGSIIAVSNDAGTVTTYSYGPYGEPSDWTGPRFRYTGQAVLPEVQAYYYKARVYDPVMGRFLQTDPIGYDAGDLNLYAYVGGDPTNKADPTGLCPQCLVIPAVCAGGGCEAAGAAIVAAGVAIQQNWQNSGIPKTIAGWLNGILHNDQKPPPPPPGVTDAPGNKPPFKGEPGSTVRGGSGSRTYGPDGYPETDRDHPHPNEPRPPGSGDHSHDWGRPAGGGPPTHEDRGPSRLPKPGDPPQPRGPNVEPPKPPDRPLG